MEGFHQQDMYDFVDDGVNKSIYTIFNQYHPFLKRDFSLASLVNHIPDIEFTNSGEIFIRDYQGIVDSFAKLLLEKTSTKTGNPDTRLSGDELNRIFDELKAASEKNTDCKFFSTIREYIEYAQKNIAAPETKELRDAIVKNSVEFLSPEQIYKDRERLMSLIYLSQAENRVKALYPKRREPGEIPEWDRLQAIKKILTRSNGLMEYEEFYDEASKEIRKAALAAMEKARVATTCRIKRATFAIREIDPSKVKYPRSNNQKMQDLFEKIKRMPKKEDNSWSFDPLEQPELLCDLQANYSENGIENQRVVAFRYGRFKYGKTQNEQGGFNIDNTEIMPELVGISRIGKDGTKTYFVLMPPIDRIKYRPVNDKTVDPGDRLLQFTVTQDVEVPTPSGGTKIQKQAMATNVVDAKTGKKVNIFRNKEIPEELEEYFAKVYFSDEYLSSAIENNARYLGSVEQGENGPVIIPTDEGKLDLAAAHYAAHFPGRVGKIMVKDFDSYCRSTELEIRQYNLVNARERELRAKVKQAGTKKYEGQGLDD